MDVLEVLLELEFLKADWAQHRLKADSVSQYMTLLEVLQNIMDMIMKNIIGKDSLAHLEQISSGDTTLTNT